MRPFALRLHNAAINTAEQIFFMTSLLKSYEVHFGGTHYEHEAPPDW